MGVDVPRRGLISHPGDVLRFRRGENLGDRAGAIAAFERAVELSDWQQ